MCPTWFWGIHSGHNRVNGAFREGQHVGTFCRLFFIVNLFFAILVFWENISTWSDKLREQYLYFFLVFLILGTKDSKDDIRRALYYQEIYQGDKNSGISEQEQPIFGKVQTNRNSNQFPAQLHWSTGECVKWKIDFKNKSLQCLTLAKRFSTTLHWIFTNCPSGLKMNLWKELF